MILHLTVDYTPQATISVSADTICDGNEIVLQASAAGSIPITYLQPIAIGDILCTDGSIEKPSAWPVAGKTAMGIVFYVDNTDAHGWAVELQEHGIKFWTTSGQEIDIPTLTNYDTPFDAITDFDGYNNTQKIRDAGNATTYPAAYAVDFANGWYLPAMGQLRLLFSEIVTLNTSLQVVGGTPFLMESYWRYWSSTERNQSNAWCIQYTGRVDGSYSKNSSIQKARGIRSF